MRAILTFHALDDGDDPLAFEPRAFAALLDALAVAAIPVVPFDELAGIPRGVAITFDDGLRSVHRHALPLLRARGLCAHLFLTTDAVGRDNAWPGQRGIAARREMLDWREVAECSAGGIRIEAHTASHPDLCDLPDEAIAAECERADARIAEHTGRSPTLFAYPYGRHDARVRAVAGRRYRACMTTRLGYYRPSGDPAALARLDAYYLRPRWLQGRFLAREGRAYIAVRAFLRALRGTT